MQHAPTISFYLASRSPRRRELLREASIDFDTIEDGVDDSELTPTRADPRHWAAALAYLKASSAHRSLCHDKCSSVVLGADTIVVKGDRIIGKPRDRDHARRIIEALRDGSHHVITGVAIIDDSSRRLIFADDTLVEVGHISQNQIDSYLATDLWRGKAGAYNLLERHEDGWPITWDGDPTTVMGLPMLRLIPLLRRYQFHP